MTHFLGVLPLHVIKWMFFSATPLSAEEVYMHAFIRHTYRVDAASLPYTYQPKRRPVATPTPTPTPPHPTLTPTPTRPPATASSTPACPLISWATRCLYLL
jgi:hypothetical protein